MNDKLIPLLRSLFSELPHPALLEAADRLENAKVIFEKIGIDGGCSAATQERLIRHLLDALERIANLKSVTQTKGPLEHMGTPEHLMDPEGWGPIQPAVKTGLCIAARIADAALDSLPGVNVKKPRKSMKPENKIENTQDGSDCQRRLVLPLPSWFAEKGVPCCSKWGKTEIEYLAWAYAAAQARDGDTWHEITPEKAYKLLTEEERRIVGGFTREGTLHHAYLDWWAMIGRQLRDAAGAFEVGGFSWTRRKFDQENVKVHTPPLATVSDETGVDP